MAGLLARCLRLVLPVVMPWTGWDLSLGRNRATGYLGRYLRFSCVATLTAASGDPPRFTSRLYHHKSITLLRNTSEVLKAAPGPVDSPCRMNSRSVW